MTDQELRIKRLNILVYIVSAVVLLLVIFMRKIHLDFGISFKFLPPLYSFINAICAICLVIAFVHIKNRRIEQHQFMMKVALTLSTLFLAAYVLYHITTPDTHYCKEGNIRYLYFFILITHVVLAAVSFPFVLLTFVRGLTDQVVNHKKLAKWVFPVWLYVCITGPICYLMLYTCYT